MRFKVLAVVGMKSILWDVTCALEEPAASVYLYAIHHGITSQKTVIFKVLLVSHTSRTMFVMTRSE
jgi:hypothetical protein